jgi:hypothetical protein
MIFIIVDPFSCTSHTATFIFIPNVMREMLFNVDFLTATAMPGLDVLIWLLERLLERDEYKGRWIKSRREIYIRESGESRYLCIQPCSGGIQTVFICNVLIKGACASFRAKLQRFGFIGELWI